MDTRVRRVYMIPDSFPIPCLDSERLRLAVADYFKRNSTKWGMSAAYRFHLEVWIFYRDFFARWPSPILRFQLRYVISKIAHFDYMARNLQSKSVATYHHI